MTTATISDVYSKNNGPVLTINRKAVTNEAAAPTLPKVVFDKVDITNSLSENGKGGSFLHEPGFHPFNHEQNDFHQH